MTTSTASPVSINFHGTNIPTFNVEGVVRVAMKPICDAIGISWSGQFERIKRHKVLGSCVRVIRMQVVGERQGRKLITLPLNKLNGWLFGVDAARVKPEVQERLVAYQSECFDVLSDYWQKGQAVNPRTATPDERAGLRAAVTMLTTKRGLMHSAAYCLVHHRFNVDHIDELSPEQLPEAVEYVHRMALEGDYLGKQTLPAPVAETIDYPLSRKWQDWQEHQLVGMDAEYHSDIRRLLKQLAEASRTGAAIKVGSIDNIREEFKALTHHCSMNGINKRGAQEKLAHLESLVASLAKTTGCLQNTLAR
ncbi:phage antirepressor N-terminal domain-containing protein [Vreelandella boliviensis]|uniref:phage antirepressor N-terminal domain-containing protein n=1 Tax=Vreelandella boliviensis TaxID=223527 RepID=UPI001B8D2D56|nr:phage antirepressor N-terminal domain-containing protein [Halomonas boliviensis]MBS3670200.1 phage antirepressor N-terminal domain-containing protein [Halomonas boliviensis]